MAPFVVGSTLAKQHQLRWFYEQKSNKNKTENKRKRGIAFSPEKNKSRKTAKKSTAFTQNAEGKHAVNVSIKVQFIAISNAAVVLLAAWSSDDSHVRA